MNAFKAKFNFMIMTVVAFGSSSAFAQRGHLPSEENPPIHCQMIAPMSANAQMKAIFSKLEGKALIYACTYGTTRLQAMLASMTLRNPANAEGKSMGIQCSNPNPVNAYAYRPRIGYQTANQQHFMVFTSSAGTSCTIETARTVDQLVSLQNAGFPVPPQMIVMPEAGMSR